MKKNLYISIGLLIIFLLVLSFGISFYNDKILNDKHNNIKEEVLSHLEDKYKEEFDIVDFSYAKNSYSFLENDELVTKNMEFSYIYNFRMVSNRLVEFDVTYVVYEDISEYNDLKQYDIMEHGIYDNYIYVYKVKSIRMDIKDGIYNNISNVMDYDIYIDYFDEENLLIDYSLDSVDEKEINKEYRMLNKDISNVDWFLFCRKINSVYALTLDIEVNSYIDKNNLEEFKEEVKSLVSYLEDSGYDNYDINFNFKNYLSARVTRYDVDNESIYLIFAYVENYSNVSDEDKLYAYILEK